MAWELLVEPTIGPALDLTMSVVRLIIAIGTVANSLLIQRTFESRPRLLCIAALYDLCYSLLSNPLQTSLRPSSSASSSYSPLVSARDRFQ